MPQVPLKAGGYSFLKILEYIVIVSFILYFGRTLFIPLSFALLISFILYPVCGWFEKHGFSHSFSIFKAIETNLKEIIKKNSIASVGTDGLMGNKLVNIYPGTLSSPLISDGDEILSIQNLDADEMLRTLEYTNSNVAVISENLKNITGNINNSKGTLYTLLMDTTLMGGIGNTIKNLDIMSSNLSMTSAELSDVVYQIKEGKGLVGVLLNDSIMRTDLQKTIREVKASGELINFSANGLKTIVQKINNGSGSIGTLLNDTGTAGRLKSSLINIENSTENLMKIWKH